ncbi:MAG TPA: universal stress protein [Solirubrobacteraceae bacterium]|jgi:nucleotide-binding universal stress UspA family protein|nr:universal stress protein [Solirubrobacteraceae bacterium]
MNPSAAPAEPTSSGSGLVLFAYDGSELAKLAIEEAGRQLARGREALVLCVWQPADVGFVPAGELHLNAAQASEVRKAAEQTAAYGAELAERAGFRTRSMAAESAPTWRGIANVAEERDVELIVLGSHGRHGFAGRVFGSVAAAVADHCTQSVLIVHRRA